MTEEAALRAQLIQTCLDMDEAGINQGTAGNASARFGGGMLITPTGVPYRDMQPEDMVFVHADGRTEGRLEPSSEWRCHLGIINTRPEVGAVIHAHPVYATAIAIMEYEIPAAHYMVGVGGGNTIRCARYATYGTAELAENALEALEGRTACLLAHHGVVTTGPDLGRALWLAVELETLAKQYYLTLTMGGPPIIDDAEIERVLEKFKTYGPRER